MGIYIYIYINMYIHKFCIYTHMLHVNCDTIERLRNFVGMQWEPTIITIYVWICSMAWGMCVIFQIPTLLLHDH